jgi:multidrug efflux pump subunit AcrA (membrane-fusion protein)
MYATVQISVDRENTLAIPRNALLRLGEEVVVFTEGAEKDGRVNFKKVVVDVDEDESSPWLAVRGGLKAGQTIVTNGAILLSQNL